MKWLAQCEFIWIDWEWRSGHTKGWKAQRLEASSQRPSSGKVRVQKVTSGLSVQLRNSREKQAASGHSSFKVAVAVVDERSPLQCATQSEASVT